MCLAIHARCHCRNNSSSSKGKGEGIDRKGRKGRGRKLTCRGTCRGCPIPPPPSSLLASSPALPNTPHVCCQGEREARPAPRGYMRCDQDDICHTAIYATQLSRTHVYATQLSMPHSYLPHMYIAHSYIAHMYFGMPIHLHLNLSIGTSAVKASKSQDTEHGMPAPLFHHAQMLMKQLV